MFCSGDSANVLSGLVVIIASGLTPIGASGRGKRIEIFSGCLGARR